MPISGIVIRIDPEHREPVLAELTALPAVETHPVTAVELVVAVLETEGFAEEQSLVERISAIAGVRGVSLAYHNFEDVVEQVPAPAGY